MHGVPRLEKHERLQAGGDLRIHDIEDLVKLGKQVAGCPYFASGSLAKEAALIFCPYSYLIDPMTRDAMGIDLTDAAVFIDEAHNIEDVCRDAAGLQLKHEDLLETCAQLETMVVSDEGSEDASHYAALEQVVRGLKDHINRWVPLLQATGSHTLAQHLASGAEAAAVLREVGVTEETLKPLNKFLETALAKIEQQLPPASHASHVRPRQGTNAADAAEADAQGEARPTAKALFIVKDIVSAPCSASLDACLKDACSQHVCLQEHSLDACLQNHSLDACLQEHLTRKSLRLARSLDLHTLC